MPSQTLAILMAQLRTLRNFYPRGNVGRLVVTWVMSVFWYGMWSLGGVFLAILLAQTDDRERLAFLLPQGLVLAFMYWQIIPILMVSTGASLDLRRLLVYPIPRRQLFALEVLLRLSTGIEMILVLTGATVGLVLNPSVPFWAPVGLLPFVLMNLFFAAGMRNLLARVLARKYVKEAGFLVLILAAALPQFFIVRGVPEQARELASLPLVAFLPFTASARMALGEFSLADPLVMFGWMAMAYAFGRWQFERGMRFDANEGRSRSRPAETGGSRIEKLYRLPSLLLPDPLGAVVEKEIRFLSRAPRFRLVFVMGFSFGLLIWLPIAFMGAGNEPSMLASNYLTFITGYAVLLLSEVTLLNSFGFDRGAAQLYFLAPKPISVVIRGKNIAAATFVVLEVGAVSLACWLLQMPLTIGKLAEACAVTAVLTLFMLSLGNLGSVHYARPVDPRQSWRSGSASRFQAMLLLVYPVITFPVVLAFLARYAFETNLAFYGVLAFDVALGAVIYWIALESAVGTIENRKESVLATLAERPSPVAT